MKVVATCHVAAGYGEIGKTASRELSVGYVTTYPLGVFFPSPGLCIYGCLYQSKRTRNKKFSVLENSFTLV